MNAMMKGAGVALGALMPKIMKASWTVTKVIAASLVLFVVMMAVLILKVSREIFISTYPR